MTVREALLQRARDYELRAVRSSELAEAGDEAEGFAVAHFATVAIVLREIADVLPAGVLEEAA